MVAAASATFGLPEVRRGIYAGAGGLFRLPAQIPEKVAMQMILPGEPGTAQRALEPGLVNPVGPAGVADAPRKPAGTITANAPQWQAR